MTKEELIERLKELAKHTDTETRHLEADRALLEFINDEKVFAAYMRVGRWYA